MFQGYFTRVGVDSYKSIDTPLNGYMYQIGTRARERERLNY